jgi:hypothetical protein
VIFQAAQFRPLLEGPQFIKFRYRTCACHVDLRKAVAA